MGGGGFKRNKDCRGICLEADCVIFWQIIWVHLAHLLKNLRAEFKCNSLGCLGEEIPRQNSIQTTAWLLLTALS